MKISVRRKPENCSLRLGRTYVWILLVPLLMAKDFKEQSTVEVKVAAEKVLRPLDKKLWANMGYDPIYAVTVMEEALPFWQLLRQTGAMRYIRMHNLFSDGFTQWSLKSPKPVYCGCRIYSEDSAGNPHYNFWHLNEVLDILLSAGLKPILEMDFMPDDLAEGEIVRNYCGGAVNTPKDYQKWRDLVYHTVKHLKQRYGADEVQQWYFEIWNEPDLKTYFIDGVRWNEKVTEEKLARFHKMYDYFVDGAKAADPKVKVGGPGIAGNQNYFRFFLKHITQENNYVTEKIGSPIDFISWHHYGEIESHLKANRQFQDIIRKEFPALANKETQQNEWGQPLRRFPEVERQRVSGVYEAVFLAQMVEKTLKHPEAGVDLFLRWGQPVLIPQKGGGWRALSLYLDGSVIPFPIHNAYMLLSKLGGEQVALESTSEQIGGIAARSSPDDVQILLYRAEGEGELTVSITAEIGKKSKQTTLTEYRLDENHGNIFGEWERMGKPKQPSAEQIERLRESGHLKPSSGAKKIPVVNGMVRWDTKMMPNSLLLVVIGKERDYTAKFSAHIQRVIRAEEMYLQGREKQKNGRNSEALQIYEKVAQEYSEIFWSQRALFGLLEIAKAEGKAEEADAIQQRLLKTTLNDTDRLELLKERSDYLRTSGRSQEASALEPEILHLKRKIERLKNWKTWSR